MQAIHHGFFRNLLYIFWMKMMDPNLMKKFSPSNSGGDDVHHFTPAEALSPPFLTPFPSRPPLQPMPVRLDADEDGV